MLRVINKRFTHEVINVPAYIEGVTWGPTRITDAALIER